MAAGRYCMKWACSARRRVRRKNFLKHPLTQKLLEGLQEQIEKATAAFMLQDSIVLIFSQLYQIVHLLETHVRGKICWKATRGSAQNQSEWTWHIYAAACPILFFLFLSAPIASFISTLPSFLLKWNKTNQTNKNPQTKTYLSCLGVMFWLPFVLKNTGADKYLCLHREILASQDFWDCNLV